MTPQEGYYIICQPSFLVTQFDSMQDLANWAREGSVKDLEEAVKVFSDAELYEHCVVMQSMMLKKMLQIKGKN